MMDFKIMIKPFISWSIPILDMFSKAANRSDFIDQTSKPLDHSFAAILQIVCKSPDYEIKSSTLCMYSCKLSFS